MFELYFLVIGFICIGIGLSKLYIRNKYVLVEAICIDIKNAIGVTLFGRNKIGYYKFIYNNKEYIVKDKFGGILPKNIKINEPCEIYIDSNNPYKNFTPADKVNLNDLIILGVLLILYSLVI